MNAMLGNEQALVILGDCREVMKRMPRHSVDAIVTDPPYGLEFMGKEWDKLAKPENLGGSADGNKHSFYRVRNHLPAMQHWHYTWALEALRVLKPGGHMLALGGTRTYHRMTSALEDARFEIRDCLMWLYGQGFPKGATLKPAWEPIVLARKPISERNIAENVLRWGTGGLWIDRCRIQGAKGDGVWGTNQLNCQSAFNASPSNSQYKTQQHSFGRCPANFILSHSQECVLVGEREVEGRTINRWDDGAKPFGGGAGHPYTSEKQDNDIVEVWACVADCPVRLLDEQSGQLKSGTGAKKWKSAAGYQGPAYGKESRSEGTPNLEYGDSGGASRFFYTPKASRSERNAGLPEGIENNHPTVKSLALMRYLCRLITPPGGLILDVFCGSGTTLVAGLQEGFRVIGIDNDANSCEIARHRVSTEQ